ncbi:MAG: imidazoleglycerol-phosphate dehydratase HisB [Victivallales bacterium]|nr:imidazoleglycerol-phosphate dehydratase HisB [Victivallales bacterium]
MSENRVADIARKTKETDINVTLNLDGTGTASISTGIPFLDHMLTLFTKHGLMDLTIDAEGDLEVDAHHTMEDLGLTLGEALAKALGDKKGIKRYGWTILPMDEALALVALDLSGRPFLVYDVEPPADRVKDIDTRLFHEFFQALCVKGGVNMHIQLLKGAETHHVFEAIFKAFAKSLDQAITRDSRVVGVPSTKGVL